MHLNFPKTVSFEGYLENFTNTFDHKSAQSMLFYDKMVSKLNERWTSFKQLI